MSPYPDSPEPVSRLIPVVVLLAAAVVVAGLFSLGTARAVDGAADVAAPAERR
jgi:hypothetical protein